ncbi:hypothetical protein SAMD00019534_049900 [Acytostelium subglobosum LB1]|uniref:hypothetical protein n=1 Tax=Acytostelium subglobosum LB1 TaxID=1410327 RepID=UPI000644E0A8|nr:hypothetical protein SAMD00019534_049900 [Acytostelium subglobosum LB1]GAM21815.1 hypothetical protein SAMD00019534_049900 [Acytostelium subglobosum LB1]|eukprot:XP_012754915.1 hypothetical protein SAMD00019534_049900 [Acytostelium subglobosum LB1]
MKCGNNGCGKEYNEDSVNQCCYHPGSAIFHEGLKGWSCCTKRVIDFDDFLQIPGCATGAHVEKQQQPQATTPKSIHKEVEPPVSAFVDGGKEFYGTKDTNRFMPKPVTPTQAAKTPVVIKDYVEVNDAPAAVIAVGTPCTRQGCKVQYVDESSRTEQCTYHPGEPVFHEGSKGWSCCKPKAAIFEEFLKIKGCYHGKHKFVAEKKIDSFVECRNDWYQSFEFVNMSIYAKGVKKDESTVQFTDGKTIDVHLVLPNDKFFKKTYVLGHTINPSKSSFAIMSTKVELKLCKDPQDSWSKLEDSELDLYRYQV